MKRINWSDHIVNLVVVIAGISIAFWLNNWSESNKEKRLQSTYLQFMTSDLSADIEEFDSLIFKDSLRKVAFKKLMFSLDNLSPDSLSWAVLQVGSLNIFDGRNVTFESLKSSGKFELLDFDLRLKIINYYHNGYKQVNEIESYYKMNFDNRIVPYLIGNLDLASGSVQKDQLDNNNFKTILGIHLSLLNQKLQANKVNLDSAKELLKRLKKELN